MMSSIFPKGWPVSNKCWVNLELHTYAAHRYLSNRWKTYPITTEAKKHELTIIQNIVHNNSFPFHIIQKLQETSE
jgi:hypothetical protein